MYYCCFLVWGNGSRIIVEVNYYHDLYLVLKARKHFIMSTNFMYMEVSEKMMVRKRRSMNMQIL